MLTVLLELTVIVLILLPSARLTGLISAIALLLLYTVAIGINLYRGRTEIECGCGSSASTQNISAWSLLRNGLVVVLVAIAAISTDGRSLNIVDGLNLVLASTVAIVLFSSGDQLIGNSSNLRRMGAAR